MSKSLSIKQRLLIGMLASLIIIWMIMAHFAYRSSSHEIEEIYDASLASYARVIAGLVVHEAQEEAGLEDNFKRLLQELGPEILHKSQVLRQFKQQLETSANDDYMTLDLTRDIQGHEYESQFAFKVLQPDGRVLLRYSEGEFPAVFRSGYYNQQFAQDTWRLFGMRLKQPELQVIVGENLNVREELLKKVLYNLLWPFLLLLPVIAGVLWMVVRQGLQPIRLLTGTVASRRPDSLEAISVVSVPSEVRPLIDELNKLFLRIASALDNEKRFTANAAHELRTPLAALKTHAQVIELNASEKIRGSVAQMLKSIDRSTHLLEQLLTLSRAEASINQGIALQPVNLTAVARGQLAEMTQAAIDKKIVPAFSSGNDNCMVKGDEALLYVVVRNLVDNAISYATGGGSVNISVDCVHGTARLIVSDDGPGIPEEQFELMQQRFQRGEHSGRQGAGLGLYIVRQIVLLHQGKMALANADTGGLIVTIELPLCV